MSEHTSEILPEPEPKLEPLLLEDRLGLFFIGMAGWHDFRAAQREAAGRIEQHAYVIMTKYEAEHIGAMSPEEFESLARKALLGALHAEQGTALPGVLGSMPTRGDGGADQRL